MHKIVLGTLVIGAFMTGAPTLASASPATPMLGGEIGAGTAEVQQVAYYWKHHRYNHRHWDKRHHRWRYY